MPIKRLVCLANSRKRSGRCVAGKELAPDGGGGWVRAVSVRPDEELSEAERQYRDGAEPGLLDIVDVPLVEHRPHSCQTENWLIERRQRWTGVGRARWDDLAAMVDSPATLWSNDSSSYQGANDRVPVEQFGQFTCSLYLLRPGSVKLRVYQPRKAQGDPARRVQAGFFHRGTFHLLHVTDPLVEAEYLARGDGEFRVGDCYATVSLGEPFQGYCYKLVAALMTPP